MRKAKHNLPQALFCRGANGFRDDVAQFATSFCFWMSQALLAVTDSSDRKYRLSCRALGFKSWSLLSWSLLSWSLLSWSLLSWPLLSWSFHCAT